MDSNLSQMAFRIGFYIAFVSGVLLLFLENGSAEQTITIFSFLLALVFLAAIVVLARLSQRRP